MTGIVEYKFEPPILVPGGVREGMATLLEFAVTGMAGRGSVLPRILFPPWGRDFLCSENLQTLPRKCLQASKVFPDQIQNPLVIPTARLMKYFSMRTEKSGYESWLLGKHPGQM